MKKKLFLWQLFGFIFTCVLGTLLHFLYEWSGENVFVSVFSAVNESTWEHMKILFVPMFAFSIAEKHFAKIDFKNYWCVKLRGIFLGISAIPIMFYCYNGIIGQSKAWLNIAIFYISAALAYAYEYKKFKKENVCCFSQNMALAFVCLIAFAFFVFTFVQPPFAIFRDPVTQTFGA